MSVSPPTPEAEPPVADADLDAPAVPFLHRRGSPRWRIESLLVRLVATCGILGISVALAAILGTQSVQAWIIGLAVSAVSVVLAAVLWSSRTL
jgi:protein-S-isoprenylcysteine O-methyltransferase Ste14